MITLKRRGPAAPRGPIRAIDTALAGPNPLHARTPCDRGCQCKICGALALPFDVVDFNKYCSTTDCYEFGISGIPVLYHRCVRCSFVFTSDLDRWTPAQFAQAIYNDDYIKVDGEYATIRPLRLVKDFSRWLHHCKPLRLLDYGSGAGVFAQGMRDRGFDRYEEFDPFSHPSRPDGVFDLITCFEVIEHTPNPLAAIADMRSLLAPDGCIVISQTLQPANLDEVRGSWWYLAPRNGHVSTFSEEALVLAGHASGLRYHRGDTLYALSAFEPKPPVRNYLAALGPSVNVVRLFAPQHLGDPRLQWHKLEQDGAWTYRWTAAAQLSWSIAWQGADLIQIRIPFRHEIRDGFARECFMRMGQWTVPCTIDRHEIVGEFLIGIGGHGVLELLTPAPERSTDPKETTDRSMGLAVLSEFPAAPAPLGQAA